MDVPAVDRTFIEDGTFLGPIIARNQLRGRRSTGASSAGAPSHCARSRCLRTFAAQVAGVVFAIVLIARFGLRRTRRLARRPSTRHSCRGRPERALYGFCFLDSAPMMG
jgi:hypothetical protein